MIEELKKLIFRVLRELYDIDVKDVTVEFTNNLNFGDLTTNVAMQIVKSVGKAPNLVANEIATALQKMVSDEKVSGIQEIKAVGGFINITLDAQNMWKSVQSDVQFDTKIATEQQKRVMVEYGQPNTHKLPHIGHLFSYVAGQSFSNILEAVGHTIHRTNYQGDIGPHVAKALYGYMRFTGDKPKSPTEWAKLLQKCYQEGSTAYDESEEAKAEIMDINKKIYTQDPSIMPVNQETRQHCLDFYTDFEQLIGINQDSHYLETMIWQRGKSIVESLIGTVYEKSQGAIIFAGSKHGLHDRVFITQNNTPTYGAKDVGLNILKYENWPYDQSIITTASEQNAYFDVVIKAIELSLPVLAGKIKHIGFGMISLSTGKMSSRTGKILSGLELVEVVRDRVAEIMSAREGLTATEKDEIVMKVTLAAIKFAFLKQNVMQDCKFDLEESVALDGRSGPYIQYTYARIQSLLSQPVTPKPTEGVATAFLEADDEKTLVRWLYRYSQTVKAAASSLSPHVIADFVYQTAQYFNAYYAKNSINSATTKKLAMQRRTLAEKTAETLKKGLALLGIETVNKM